MYLIAKNITILLLSTVIIFVACSNFAEDNYIKIIVDDKVKLPSKNYGIFKVINENIILANGEINSQSLNNFNRLINEHPNIQQINILEIGGSMDDDTNLKLSLKVHQLGINTHLLDNGLITSGGVDFFLAGINRSVGTNVKIGVHSWATTQSGKDIQATDFPKGHQEHQKYIDYYQNIGFSQQQAKDFYYFTINAAKANNMYYMNTTQIEKYRVTTQDKPFITNNPNYIIYPNKSLIKPMPNKYRTIGFDRLITAYISNGKGSINIIAQDEVSDEQLLRAYNILSFYLTDFGNTAQPKSAIIERMIKNNALLVLANGQDDGKNGISYKGKPIEIDGQPLYAGELPTEGSKAYIDNDYGFRDAAFEEILHMVHDNGIGTTQNRQILPDFANTIKKATFNALPQDKADWGTKGLWGLGVQSWLIELEQEESLEQEYLAAVIDSYYGLWEAYQDSKGMWGLYIAKSRAEIKSKDPVGYNLVTTNFFNPYITYMARIDPKFSGEFKLYLDKSNPYTYKSQYFINARLLGSNNSNLTGNTQNNILIGNMGNNIIDGKTGNDIVQFSGYSKDYTIVKKGSDIEVQGEGVDTLTNIEILRFRDKDIASSSI